MKQIKSVGIVGAGQMGAGITQLFAQHGYKVLLCDVDEVRCIDAIKQINDSFERLLIKGKISSECRSTAVKSIYPINNLNDLHAVDLVVEAASENIDLKIKLFKDLDQVTHSEVVLASNTSSIPIFKLAEATNRPSKVIGIHFMNPPYLIDGVEMICGNETDEETAQLMTEVLNSLGKTIIRVGDGVGFAVNRILFPMINEAIRMLEEGIMTKESIDDAMITCCHLPMGPLKLADMIGLDTVRNILAIMYEKYGERYRPAEILHKMVCQGKLGKKTGCGFYEYISKP